MIAARNRPGNQTNIKNNCSVITKRSNPGDSQIRFQKSSENLPLHLKKSHGRFSRDSCNTSNKPKQYKNASNLRQSGVLLKSNSYPTDVEPGFTCIREDFYSDRLQGNSFNRHILEEAESSRFPQKDAHLKVTYSSNCQPMRVDQQHSANKNFIGNKTTQIICA